MTAPGCQVPACPDPPEQYGFCLRHAGAMSVATRSRLVSSLFMESQYHDREAATARAVEEAKKADSPQMGLFGEGS